MPSLLVEKLAGQLFSKQTCQGKDLPFFSRPHEQIKLVKENLSR